MMCWKLLAFLSFGFICISAVAGDGPKATAGKELPHESDDVKILDSLFGNYGGLGTPTFGNRPVYIYKSSSSSESSSGHYEKPSYAHGHQRSSSDHHPEHHYAESSFDYGKDSNYHNENNYKQCKYYVDECNEVMHQIKEKYYSCKQNRNSCQHGLTNTRDLETKLNSCLRRKLSCEVELASCSSGSNCLSDLQRCQANLTLCQSATSGTCLAELEQCRTVLQRCTGARGLCQTGLVSCGNTRNALEASLRDYCSGIASLRTNIFTSANSQRFYVSIGNPLNWPDAHSFCVRNRMSLAKFDSPAEVTNFMNMLSSNGILSGLNVAIAANDQFNEGVLAWWGGVPTIGFSIPGGTPNQAGLAANFDCVKSSSTRWSMYNCNDPSVFACKIPPVCHTRI